MVLTGRRRRGAPWRTRRRSAPWAAQPAGARCPRTTGATRAPAGPRCVSPAHASRGCVRRACCDGQPSPEPTLKPQGPEHAAGNGGSGTGTDCSRPVRAIKASQSQSQATCRAPHLLGECAEHVDGQARTLEHHAKPWRVLCLRPASTTQCQRQAPDAVTSRACRVGCGTGRALRIGAHDVACGAAEQACGARPAARPRPTRAWTGGPRRGAHWLRRYQATSVRMEMNSWSQLNSSTHSCTWLSDSHMPPSRLPEPPAPSPAAPEPPAPPAARGRACRLPSRSLTYLPDCTPRRRPVL